MGVTTADGSQWSETGVSYALRALQPASAVQASDDLIRQQIKDGRYDTEEESFICVRKKLKKSSKNRMKGKSSKPVEKKKNKKSKNKVEVRIDTLNHLNCRRLAVLTRCWKRALSCKESSHVACCRHQKKECEGGLNSGELHHFHHGKLVP
ncbi:hypothetical protein [Candidatus Vondammii sp. HM_W22]|uniref:hypothetical protein n=1 Tax=Candidatus Vondammii sp. HM_W22 TaxID=2687299 RepID=UPI001F12919A|nr:hypothetical protein [Candidatus Vondammii sp. HM_W22]